jgi:hypothetical protein
MRNILLSMVVILSPNPMRSTGRWPLESWRTLSLASIFIIVSLPMSYSDPPSFPGDSHPRPFQSKRKYPGPYRREWYVIRVRQHNQTSELHIRCWNRCHSTREDPPSVRMRRSRSSRLLSRFQEDDFYNGVSE